MYTHITSALRNSKNKAQHFTIFTEVFYREEITDTAFVNCNEMLIGITHQYRGIRIGILQVLGTTTV